jgi:hypothetical protein
MLNFWVLAAQNITKPILRAGDKKWIEGWAL